MSNIIVSLKRLLNNMLHSEKGASDSVLITFIGIATGVVLMFVVPIMFVSGQNTDIAQNVAESATAEFGYKIATASKIKVADFEEYEKNLLSTGNTFEITIEVQHLDENFGAKNGEGSQDLIGENQRYSTFYSNITEDIELNKRRQCNNYI